VPAPAGARLGEPPSLAIAPKRDEQMREGAPVAEVPSRAELPRAEWPPTPPGVNSDFCIDGIDALDEETCYVLPSGPTEELLIYLHGIVPPAKVSVQKTSFETVVANASRRAGVAALLPRGRQGLAPKDYAGWWGWPTSAAAYARLAPELVVVLEAKRKKLEALTATAFSRVYLAGSSSGAYFVAALAQRGDLQADAFGAIAGGAPSSQADLGSLRPRPVYIGFGRHDSVASSARQLGEGLSKAGWPVQIAVHPFPHGTHETYLDEAFAFWRRELPALPAPP
jgi:predicted esterase